MWTAEIKSVTKHNDLIHVNVEFKNTDEVVVINFKLATATDLNALIQNEITRLTALYDFAELITPGPVNVTPTPEIPPAPELSAFKNKLDEYRNAVRLFDAGLVNKQQVDTLQIELKALFKDEFKKIV